MMEKVCEICGQNKGKLVTSEKYKKTLCNKHYKQYVCYKTHLDNSPLTFKDKNELVLYNDYAEIILRNQSGVEIARAIVDIDKVEKVKQHKWGLHSEGYARTTINSKRIYLHRFIINCEVNMQIDHINNNRLDNRTSNLRACTAQQNSFNTEKYSHNTSGHRGVVRDKRTSKWVAQITGNKKHIHLGSYENFDDAVKARLEAEEKYFGEFAHKNKDI